MNYRLTINLNREYFTESFNQSIKYASKMRKVEYIISIVFILSGIGLYIYANGETFLPVAFIAVGLFEYFSPHLKRIFWVKRQMSNKAANTSIEIHITDDALLSKGQYSEGNMRWDGMDRVLETPKGVFVWPQKGIHIYIPKSEIPGEIIDFISTKITAQKNLA